MRTSWLVKVTYFLFLLALASPASSGCSESQVADTDESGAAATETAPAPAYQRQEVEFYKGIIEPSADALSGMAEDVDRLLEDNMNSVSLSPPVLITQRAGGRPRVIMEANAAAVSDAISDFHDSGLAVHLAPTTASPGFKEEVEPTETTLDHLKEDALKWAETAEEKKVELFSPLSRYNLVLGEEAADKWSKELLPEIREKYKGLLVAKVTPQTNGSPEPGEPYDFETLDYSGYDYLMVEIFPQGESFDPAAYEKYVKEVLGRADTVAARDGLKGVIVGGFGAWREYTGMDQPDSPQVGVEGQFEVASILLNIAIPRTSGAFYQGWTLPGRGAKNFPVEEKLRELFGP